MCTGVIVAFLMLKAVNSLALVTDSFGGATDVAVSHAVLSQVAAGTLGATMRLHVPDAVLAFGRADRVTPGYPQAVRAGAAHGFEAVERLAGGRAAVFHHETLAFSLAIPDPEPRSRIKERFEMISGVMARAFNSLAIDARVGEIAGEYCPGEWSVNVGGRIKVMGVGQRLVRGATHIGGVVVVDAGRRIRDVLIPVYRALGLDWDPRTAGALADRAPGITCDEVTRAIENAMSEHFLLEQGELPDAVLEEAQRLIDDHLPKVA